MNTVKKIESMYEAKEDARFKYEMIERDFENTLRRKVLRLHSVGRSVLMKKLGSERFRRLNSNQRLVPIAHKYMWLLEPNPRIEFRMVQTKQGWSEVVVGNYLVPLSRFQIGDRDYAKEIRESLLTSVPQFEDREYAQAQETMARIEAARNSRKSKVKHDSSVSVEGK